MLVEDAGTGLSGGEMVILSSAGQTERSYYYFGGQRVAMREAGVVYWLLTDHLGSTALTLNSSGINEGVLRYKAYGETRYTWGTTPTDYRFTGQRQDSYIKLYAMGARHYDPELGRWVSPDSIVPDPTNPQSLNRYSYTRNNPLSFRDPSGHMEIYGGSFAPYSDYWHTYVNPNAPGCQSDLEFIKQGASLVVDFTPGLGDAKGFAEVFTGKDLITGESLGAWRFLGLVGLSELRHLRYADEVLEMGVAIGRGLGQWGSRSVHMSDAARAYQQYVTGAEAGYEFLRNGVWFDGIRMSDAGEAILLDAKSGANFYRKAGSLPFVEQTVLDEAYSQLTAAAGLHIQWHIQDYAAWEAMRDLFAQKGIDIEVVWTPGP